MAKTAPEPDTAELAKHDGLTTPDTSENKRIPVPFKEHLEPEQQGG
uniref:Uncharacterized protein n=1 Tax=Acinetobacter baumannii TaxID=470 RepID=A0A125S0T6_ACIBA|nr:hypothetical protein [Acinetobacter baumannii]